MVIICNSLFAVCILWCRRFLNRFPERSRKTMRDGIAFDNCGPGRIWTGAAECAHVKAVAIQVSGDRWYAEFEPGHRNTPAAWRRSLILASRPVEDRHGRMAPSLVHPHLDAQSCSPGRPGLVTRGNLDRFESDTGAIRRDRIVGVRGPFWTHRHGLCRSCVTAHLAAGQWLRGRA